VIQRSPSGSVGRSEPPALKNEGDSSCVSTSTASWKSMARLSTSGSPPWPTSSKTSPAVPTRAPGLGCCLFAYPSRPVRAEEKPWCLVL
jgi:hypothetical protein